MNGYNEESNIFDRLLVTETTVVWDTKVWKWLDRINETLRSAGENGEPLGTHLGPIRSYFARSTAPLKYKWLLLSFIAKTATETDVAEWIVFRALVRHDPSLLFISTAHGNYLTAVQNAGLQDWRTGTIDRGVPEDFHTCIFSSAAKDGKLQVVRETLQLLDEVSLGDETRRHDIYEHMLPVMNNSADNALYLAMGAHHHEVVKELLNAHPQMADALVSLSVSERLEKNNPENLSLLKAFAESFKKLEGGKPEGWDWGGLLEKSIRSSDDKTSKWLARQEPLAINSKIMQDVIEKDNVSLWEDFLPFYMDSTRSHAMNAPTSHMDDKFSLLEKAIEHGRQRQAIDLLDKDPCIATRGDPHSDEVEYCNHALSICYERLKRKPSPAIEEIRHKLVRAMVLDNRVNLGRMEEELRKNGGGSVCIDLQQFDSERFHFADLVQKLKEWDPKSFKFERTLRYVKIPDLEPSDVTKPSHLSQKGFDGHTEVEEFMTCLGKCGVEMVVKLQVLDRKRQPHDDAVIADICENFCVQELDWRRLDLSVCELQKKKWVREGLRSLHLYSSGTIAVLNEWFSSDGLENLAALEKLHIYVVTDHIGSIKLKKLETLIQNGIDALEIKRAEKANAHEAGQGQEGGQAPNLGQNQNAEQDEAEEPPEPWGQIRPIIWHRQQAVRKAAEKTAKKIIGGDLFGRISSYIEKYRLLDFSMKGVPRIKVAVIDTGVMATDINDMIKERNLAPPSPKSPDTPNLISIPVVEGTSFVCRDDEAQPWFCPREPHGTQMAHLIRALDPRCELLVIRVADGSHYPITTPNLAQAIDWARLRGADIACMSLALSSDSLDDQLITAVQEARKSNMLMFAATPDKGRNETSSALNREELSDCCVQIIAACDRNGKRLKSTPSGAFDWMICGEDVEVGAVDFLTSATVETGSSISTAIAVGLASLTVSSAWYAGDPDASRRVRRLNMIKKRFESMSRGGQHRARQSQGPIDKKYVRIDNFLSSVKVGPELISLNDDFMRTEFGEGHQNNLKLP